MTGVALQFHFGQYVEFLGHGVDTLGRILSVSMIGTLLIRLHVGRWIDRFGCRPVWLVGTLAVASAVGTIQLTDRLWLITLLRMISTMATAAVLTTLAVFAAQVAPANRRAESIGTIGLAGFVGMIAGPALGDWIFSSATDSILPYRLFFSATALCSLLAGGAMLVTRMPGCGGSGGGGADSSQGSTRTVRAQWSVIRRHWPGAILLVGLVFTMAFCVQSMFLERLAEAQGFKNIKLFFLVYCPTAMVLRLVFRRLPQRLGRSRTLLLGLGLLGSGQLCLVGVAAQWQLMLPGMLMGAGHCFIFPSMVDLGAERLPAAYRGTGTALVLGAGDLGMLIGYLTLGELIDAVGFGTSLQLLAITVFAGAAVFAIARRRDVFRRRGRRLGDVAVARGT